MNKATTLLLLLAATFLRSQAQPTAATTTLAPQLYTAGQYITVPATAFSGTVPSGMYFSAFYLTQFPLNTLSLKATPKGGSQTTYTSLPPGSIQLGVNSAGQPQGTIQVLPANGTDTVRIFYMLWATNNNGVGSSATGVACVYIPLYTVPLNVTLAHFAGKADDASTWLEWATESEEGLRGFEVEWSTNLSEWSAVTSIAGRGAGSVYEWRHESPAQGGNFYRVRAVSQSGASSYSAVVKVNHGGRVASVSATPNPTRDFLRIEGPAGSVASLIDLGGKEVVRLHLSASSTMDMKHLASGMYQLTVRSAGGGILAQERIVKP